MKFKFIIMVFITSIFMLPFLFGCSTDITKQIATENQLLSDISEIQSLKECFESDFVYQSDYFCKDIEIVKRQTNRDEKTDAVYLCAIMENDYFRVTLDMTLNYVFYDVGGWLLEDYDWSLIDAEPLRSPEYLLVRSKMVFEESENPEDMPQKRSHIDVYFPLHSIVYYANKFNVANVANGGNDHIYPIGEDLTFPNCRQVRADFSIAFMYFNAKTHVDLFFDLNGWQLTNDYFYLDEIANVYTEPSIVGKYEYQRQKPGGTGAILSVYNVDYATGTIEYKYDYFRYDWMDFWSGHQGEYETKAYYGEKSTQYFDPFSVYVTISIKGDTIKYYRGHDLWFDYFNGGHYRDGMWGAEYDRLEKVSDNPF